MTDDPAATAYLNQVGARIASHLPGPQVQFRYFLIDAPYPNAFSLPVGRIYVTRGMAAFVRNEDELAGVLGHEMGHILTRQGVISLSALMRDVLGVNQISSRRDIVVNLAHLQESWMRDQRPFRQVKNGDFERETVADQIALYAIANAGYATHAYIDLFDRVAETNGKTGNWFSDFFQLAKPNERRLGDIVRSIQNLPPACKQAFASNAAEFQKWRATVLEFSNWKRTEGNLHDVISQVKLDPILLPNVTYVKFSPDGKYILAQETDQIHILTREPLAYLFHIDARNAIEPQFTPDSRSVAFVNFDLHVEFWDLATQKRVRADDVLEKRCPQVKLSPDANTLACADPAGALSLIDLRSNIQIFKKGGVGKDALAGPVHLGFSPDSHYFLALTLKEVVGFDLSTGKSIPLRNLRREWLAGRFAFLGSDRIIGFVASTGLAGSISYEETTPTLFAFPSGKVLDTLPVGFAALRASAEAPARGDYVILRPFDKYAVAVLDLKSKQGVLVSDKSTLDVYDDVYVRPRLGGDLGLFDIKTRQLKSSVSLGSNTDAGRFVRSWVSPDLKWVAGCGVSRCAIWNADTGKRAFFVRPFTSAWFDGHAGFYADFPKFQKVERSLARIDLSSGDMQIIREIDVPYTSLSGGLLLTGIPRSVKRDYPLQSDVTWEVHDVVTGQELWSRHFAKQGPGVLAQPGEGRILFRWPSSTETARDEIQTCPRVVKQVAETQANNKVDLLEVLDASNGQILTAMLVDGAPNIFTAGERLIASHAGYFSIYSLSTGAKEGEILGAPGAYSKSTASICVRGANENQLAIYDLKSRRKLDEFTFPGNIDTAHFSEDGQRLFVLTSDETVYSLDLSRIARPASGMAAAAQH